MTVMTVSAQAEEQIAGTHPSGIGRNAGNFKFRRIGTDIRTAKKFAKVHRISSDV